MVSLLLQHKADVEAVNVKAGNTTAAIVAATRGHAEILSLLLDNGAKINAESRAGVSPLIAAIQNKSERVVRLLLARKADTGMPLYCAGVNMCAWVCLL